MDGGAQHELFFVVKRADDEGGKNYARPAPLAPRAGFGTSIFSPSDTARAYPIAAIVEYIAAFVPCNDSILISCPFSHHTGDFAITHLVEEDSEHRLEDQKYAFERKVPFSERPFQEWRRVFERECEDGHDHRNDLDERDRDDYRNDEVIARVRSIMIGPCQKRNIAGKEEGKEGDVRRNRRRRVGKTMIDKVPEELAVQDTPNRRPNQVYRTYSRETGFR